MTKAEKIAEIIRIMKKLSGESMPEETPSGTDCESVNCCSDSDCQTSIQGNEHMKEAHPAILPAMIP